MKRPKITFKKLHPNARIPQYQSDKSSGMDLHAIEDTVIPSLEVGVIRTGLSVQLPKDSELQIRPRSGLSVKFPGYVANSPGTVDEDYRGEIFGILYNKLFNKDLYIKKGDRVMQCVVVPILRPEIVEGELSKTERDSGGFGSTGLEEADTKNGKATI